MKINSALDPLLSIKNLELFIRLSAAIKEVLPMDLSVGRDRIGKYHFSIPGYPAGTENKIHIDLGWIFIEVFLAPIDNKSTRLTY